MDTEVEQLISRAKRARTKARAEIERAKELIVESQKLQQSFARADEKLLRVSGPESAVTQASPREPDQLHRH